MPVAVLDSPFNSVISDSPGPSTTLVPVPFIVAINGHTYVEDLEFKPWKRQAFRATTTQTTRTQADTSNEPGEQSLSTTSLWRRTQDSWHQGASQVFLDRKNSSEFMFRQSKGVNPWTQWQLTLLNDTAVSFSSANNIALAVCGSHLYAIDGQTLKYTTDLTTWTTVTGTPAVTASAICSDGHTVYVAYGASGIYSTTEGAATASQYVTSAIAGGAVLRYVMGRLMLTGGGGTIYNITGSGALPAPLFTSNISAFVWQDFAAGLSVIYAGGFSGDKSTIYRIGITSDAVALSAPVVAGQLPYGEVLSTLYGYVGGTLAIGTAKGWRFAEQANTAGDLTIGPLVPQPVQVAAFSGFDRFIWGTYTNYDSASTGLFRMDPTQFTADLTPAWATDLMAATQGQIVSLVHFNGNPVFVVGTVSGDVVYKQASTYVASGTIDSGLITYGLADNKMPVFVDLTYTMAAGSIATSVALNGGSFTQIGVANQPTLTFAEQPTPQNLSERIEIRETLNAGSSNTVTPVLQRHTLRAVPAPAVPTDWTVVIQLREGVLVNDVTAPLVPSAEYAYLDNLRATKQIATLQIGNMGPYNVTLETIDWIPEQKNARTGELNGVAVITARTVV